MKYRDKIGPIPADNWDNNLEYDPNIKIDKSPGSAYDTLSKRVAEVRAKRGS